MRAGSRVVVVDNDLAFFLFRHLLKSRHFNKSAMPYMTPPPVVVAVGVVVGPNDINIPPWPKRHLTAWGEIVDAQGAIAARVATQAALEDAHDVVKLLMVVVIGIVVE